MKYLTRLGLLYLRYYVPRIYLSTPMYPGYVYVSRIYLCTPDNIYIPQICTPDTYYVPWICPCNGSLYMYLSTVYFVSLAFSYPGTTALSYPAPDLILSCTPALLYPRTPGSNTHSYPGTTLDTWLSRPACGALQQRGWLHLCSSGWSVALVLLSVAVVKVMMMAMCGEWWSLVVMIMVMVVSMVIAMVIAMVVAMVMVMVMVIDAVYYCLL